MVRQNKIWIFKSYTQMVVAIILFTLFIAGFVYIGTIDFHKDDIKDNEKFISEHKEVDLDNVYTYVNSTDAYTYIKGNDVLLLFGVKDNDWVGYYANILNSVAKELEIDKIYYYDITSDRKDKNATYESIANYLSSYLIHLDDGTYNIYGPTFIIKKDGVITYFDDETATLKGNAKAYEYWNSARVAIKENNLKEALKDYLRSKDGEE